MDKQNVEAIQRQATRVISIYLTLIDCNTWIYHRYIIEDTEEIYCFCTKYCDINYGNFFLIFYNSDDKRSQHEIIQATFT